MMKKLICLCVVLVIAGTASAATSHWKNGVSSGDWATASNWLGAAALSQTNGSTYVYRTDGGAAAVTVSSGTSGQQLQLQLGFMGGSTFVPTASTQTTLTINSGGQLLTTRRTDLWSTISGSTSTLVIYGTYSGETSSSNVNFSLASGSGCVSTDTVKVYGTFNVGAGVTGTTTALSITAVGSGTGAKGTLDIYSGGITTVKAYTIGTSGTGRIYIEAGGKMYIDGNVTSQVSTDSGTNHKLQVATFDTNGAFVSGRDLTSSEYGYDSGTGKTWIIPTPEPATVALLGLGGLMLIRRKR